MSQHMEESTAQGLVKNFTKAMQTFVKNAKFEARHNYKLQLQRGIRYSILFHAEMSVISCTYTKRLSREM